MPHPSILSQDSMLCATENTIEFVDSTIGMFSGLVERELGNEKLENENGNTKCEELDLGISEIWAEEHFDIYLLDEEREYLKGEMDKLVIF